MKAAFIICSIGLSFALSNFAIADTPQPSKQSVPNVQDKVNNLQNNADILKKKAENASKGFKKPGALQKIGKNPIATNPQKPVIQDPQKPVIQDPQKPVIQDPQKPVVKKPPANMNKNMNKLKNNVEKMRRDAEAAREKAKQKLDQLRNDQMQQLPQR